MSQPRAFVHAVAAGLVPFVGLGGLVGGSSLATGTALAGFAVLAHLALGEQVVRRFVVAAARQDDPGAVGRLLTRQLTTLPLALVLLSTVGAHAAGLAFASVALGAIVHASVVALHGADVRALAPEATC